MYDCCCIHNIKNKKNPKETPLTLLSQGARNGPALDVKAHVLEVKVAWKFGKFDIKSLILFI